MKPFLLYLLLLAFLVSSCDRDNDPAPPAATFKVVYSSSAVSGTPQFDIFTKEGDKAPVRIAFATGFNNRAPRISPNKQKILFFRTPVGIAPAAIPSENELWVMNADGSAPVKIVAKNTNGWSQMSAANWSPDGTKITVAAKKSGGDLAWHIFIINADGSNPVQVTTRTAFYNMPAFSPDGSKITCIGVPPGSGSNVTDSTELYTMNLNGSAETRLTFNTVANANPVWSPDTESIMFSEQAGASRNEIKAIKPDGTNLRTLFSDANDNRSARYNPVGDFVFFIRQTPGTAAHVSCVQRNGQNLVDITTGISTIDEDVDVIN
ncbi:MAG: PD40 domain-containing protein [Dinghuibacter sp.]|nr:PD40 domain-containing protein [Dinghuibacter sp.]